MSEQYCQTDAGAEVLYLSFLIFCSPCTAIFLVMGWNLYLDIFY